MACVAAIVHLQAHAFQMLSDVLHTTPHLVVGTVLPRQEPPGGADHKYFAAGFYPGTTAANASIATDSRSGGASGDRGDHAVINVVFVARMADQAWARSEVLVRVGGLSPGARYTAQAFIIDDGPAPSAAMAMVTAAAAAAAAAAKGLHGGPHVGDGPRNNVPVGPPQVTVVDGTGTAVLPNSFPGGTPGVLRVELRQL